MLFAVTSVGEVVVAVASGSFSSAGDGEGSGSFSIASRWASRAARSSFSPAVPSPRIVPPVLTGTGAVSSVAAVAFSPPSLSVEGRGSTDGALDLSGELSPASFGVVSAGFASGLDSPTANIGTT